MQLIDYLLIKSIFGKKEEREKASSILLPYLIFTLVGLIVAAFVFDLW